jgi:uncharacterized membrane protein AbrB (regulator of aidB expression)
MLGPMIAGMLVEAGQPAIRLPRLPFNIAQGIIGCMIASVLTPAIAPACGLTINPVHRHKWPKNSH